ncbi:MAG: F0F1 ATP synthase subunit B [Actinobacteria bacterium]|nr:F0F1 ATP synthase subunit B [Actinomycetota bacterium]
MNALLFAAEEGGGASLILPHTEELIYGAITFLLVLLVLTRYAFPKLRETVEARENQIQSDLEAAEAAKNEAQKQQKDYEKQIAEARSEANRVIEDARQQAEQVRKDIIAKAERDAEQVVARAQEQIEAERNRTVVELQKTVADMSIELAEKVVGRSLDDGSHRELVDNYIREVGAMGGNGRGTNN